VPFSFLIARRGRIPSSRALVALALTLSGAASCICPPEADVILDLGFRSPEQTFLTFQTGMRGDLPRLEYACLSSEFRARNGVSQLAYREFRDRELSRLGRRGIVDARITGREELSPRAVRLLCSSHGEQFELIFVREDFAQAYSGELLLHDELLNDRSTSLGEEPHPDGGRELFAITTLPAGTGDAPVTELRIGSEWKIDDLPRSLDSEPSVPEN
jgi:hypothetical protein